MVQPITLYLADLTYVQQGLQSEIMPNAIGCVGAYAKRMLGDRVEIRIFKRPDRFIAAVREKAPDIVGFSNYAWNHSLSCAFAKSLKTRLPRTITVFGGPNYPLEQDRQETFLRDHPEIDFYVVNEGEIAFASLLGSLIDTKFDRNATYDIPSVHYISNNGGVCLPPLAPRIRDLSEVPSPYLLGWLDEFFGDGFWPIIQTNRGCPFSCTFCVEGTNYFNKIYTSTQEKVRAELDYIGRQMVSVIAAGGSGGLFIADSNFGMYKDDISTCQAIRECQERYGWPKYISVATGKNQKERVLEAATLVQGALRLSGSVQSLDEKVLENIKRKNVSVDQIMQVAIMGGEIGANTYSEVILGLPGDTKQGHYNSIASLVEAGFNRVETYTLMLLHGSELNSPETREKFGLVTRYRVIPRCFGYFDFCGDRISVGEIEEVVIANNTMTFDDYIECRKLALLVVLFHNGGLFEFGIRLLKLLGVRIFDCISSITDSAMDSRLAEFFDKFANETRDELWTSRQDLERFLADPTNVDRYISGELGSNLIFKYKSMAMLEYVDSLGLAFAQVLKRSVAEKLGTLNQVQEQFISELISYSTAQGKNIFSDTEMDVELDVHFDFEEVLSRDLFGELGRSILPQVRQRVVFRLGAEQQDVVRRLVNTYGSSIPGLTRGITRTNIKWLQRQPTESYSSK
jgi:radical SAM superfamily enzyme YgiQ (UPF0313 family)